MAGQAPRAALGRQLRLGIARRVQILEGCYLAAKIRTEVLDRGTEAFPFDRFHRELEAGHFACVAACHAWNSSRRIELLFLAYRHCCTWQRSKACSHASSCSCAIAVLRLHGIARRRYALLEDRLDSQNGRTPDSHDSAMRSFERG